MAAVSPPADEAAGLLENLSLDVQPKPMDMPQKTNKPVAKQHGPVNPGNFLNGHIPPYERPLTPLLHDLADPTMCYLPNPYPSTAYYLGGYDGTGNGWDNFSRYGNAEGFDISSGLNLPRPLSAMSSGNGYVNRFYPNKFYSQYGGMLRTGIGFHYDTQTNGRGWLGVDNKYKYRGRGDGIYGYVNGGMDGLNELSRGPRAKGPQNQKTFSSVMLTVTGQNLLPSGANEEKLKPNVINEPEQYNKADFPEQYADAKFFVIKSYSEDDVHKSIKYNVWASTPNGNKKLDAAYKDAQEKAGVCPVFLFFSVNTSGQFVGVAEMIGPVDFEKNVEYWQQDKWSGHFPVKWHIVKDVPNSLLKHIILENNENKPVTNSRDTQEVKLEQGLQMIKIFKDHSFKACLLDDFEFYENRQRAIQERKTRQQQFQKQVWEGKLMNVKKDITNGELKAQKASQVFPDKIKETAILLSSGDTELLEDPKCPAPSVQEVISNGGANAAVECA
ncbi:hypothetical protein SAY86_019094 [Trapa natans]|uniref:YTH domain-containing family protein n=1 Tax=Trapa natans TaxID=22666 RepID=A0AAN7R2D0_TRANT|nr:hypothetical protein SAY86_019094 [Trapa natans]